MNSSRKISPGWMGFSLFFLTIGASRQHYVSSRANALLASPLLFVRNIRKSGRNESIAIRHLNFRQRHRVQHVVFLDDVALGENVRRKSVDLVRGERSTLTSRHRAVDKVPNRSRVWPVAPYGSYRPKRCQRLKVSCASYQAGANLGSLSSRAVAYRTFCSKDRGAVLGASLSRRESLPVRSGRNIPGLNFLLRWRSADIRVRGRLCQRRGRDYQDNPKSETARKAHFSHSHP